MKKEKTMMALYAGCLAVLCACTESQELSNAEGIDEPVELQINPTMTLTGGGARDTEEANNPTAFAKGATIAVFAVGTAASDSNYGNGNNYAVYTLGESSAWGAGDNHIYLTSEVATIYAVSPSPASTPSSVSADATVEVETFAGDANLTTSEGANNLITAAVGATNNINIAPGEKDYMYAEKKDGNQPTASNGKGTGAPGTSVDLDMHHALAMVSFRVYKGKNYKGDGHLTKIQMKNKGTNTAGTPLKLQKPKDNAKANMKIGDGTIALGGDEVDITYTRYIHQATVSKAADGDKFYALQEAATTGTENSPAFSIMLYPIACADANSATSDIQAIFTVDGTDYPVDIPACAWAKGTNNMYGATLDGQELSLGSVTITQWQSTTISNGLNLIQNPNAGTQP